MLSEGLSESPQTKAQSGQDTLVGALALANKYAEHWCSLPESKEMVGEAEAPMNSKLSMSQLRSRVSSCVHLPLLFQVSPGAVSDMWCGALATDDDTIASIEIFSDGSSLIPKAWPRVAASGGWGVLVSAICDNQRIAVIGMFFGEVTVDSGHPFFCGANNVQIGACEIQAIWRLWLGVTMSAWRPRVSQSDQTV